MTAVAGAKPLQVHPQPARLSVFSPFLYRCRNLIERYFNRLKHFKAVETRYDKRDYNFPASVQLAAIRIWLQQNESLP
jgi:transposase